MSALDSLIKNNKPKVSLNKGRPPTDIVTQKKQIKETVVYDIVRSKLKLIENSNIKKYEIYDPKEKKIIKTDKIITIINDKPKMYNKDIPIMDFDCTIDDIKDNSNMLYISHMLNKKVFVHQYVTTRYIKLYFVFKNDKYYIAFMQKSNKISSFKKMFSKEDKEIVLSPSTKKLILDEGFIGVKIDNHIKDVIIMDSDITDPRFSNCETYDQIFEICLELYSKTIDLNYIKSLDRFTREVYGYYKEKE